MKNKNEFTVEDLTNAQRRRDTLYRWYSEKSNLGWHKEWNFEQLKNLIKSSEEDVENMMLILDNQSKKKEV